MDADTRWRIRTAGGLELADGDGGDADLLRAYGSFCTPSGILREREEVERIEAAFDRLAEADRELITLARIARLPHAEIGQELGISAGAVQMRVYRALERLSVELARRP